MDTHFVLYSESNMIENLANPSGRLIARVLCISYIVFTGLFLGLLGAKVHYQADILWAWVFAPLWAPVVFVGVMGVFAIVGFYIAVVIAVIIDLAVERTRHVEQVRDLKLRLMRAEVEKIEVQTSLIECEVSESEAKAELLKRQLNSMPPGSVQ